ncbi:hypothetical protein BH11PSE7_BH11PSE7_03310 [soil metagenome]
MFPHAAARPTPYAATGNTQLPQSQSSPAHSGAEPLQGDAPRQLTPGTPTVVASAPRLPLTPNAAPADEWLERQYAILNLPMTPETRVDEFHAGAVMPPGPKVLGAGSFNTVYGVTYRRRDGSLMNAAFKPLNNGEMLCSDELGINEFRPRIANRNLATRAVAGLLDFHVIPDMHIGTCTSGAGKLELGLVMAHAPGQPAYLCPMAFRSVNVMREAAKLQLLDHLVAQVDRHPNNYFVKMLSDGSAVVTGIDLDNSFSARIKRPNTVAMGEGSLQINFRGTLMPKVVDRQMAQAIVGLPPEALAFRLRDLLTHDEIQATLERHKALVAHITGLQKQGLVIESADWAEPWVQAFLTPETSYVGRDREDDPQWAAHVGAGGHAAPLLTTPQVTLPPLETKEPPVAQLPAAGSPDAALRGGDVDAVQAHVLQIIRGAPSPEARFDALAALLQPAGQVQPAAMIKLLRLVANTAASGDSILTRSQRQALFRHCDQRCEPYRSMLQAMLVSCTTADQVDDLHAIAKGFVIAGTRLDCLTWEGGRQTAVARALATPGTNACAVAAVMCGLLSDPAERMPLHQLGVTGPAIMQSLTGVPQGAQWQVKLDHAVALHERQLEAMLKAGKLDPGNVAAPLTWVLQEGKAALAMPLLEMHFRQAIERHGSLVKVAVKATPLLTVMSGPNPKALLAARMVEQILACAAGPAQARAVLDGTGLSLKDLFKALSKRQMAYGDQVDVKDEHPQPRDKMLGIIASLRRLNVPGVDIAALEAICIKAAS